jgi:myo-inositol-1(or 4)-monophosphatase
MKYNEELNMLKTIVPKLFELTEESEKKISYKQKNEIVTSSDLFIEKALIKEIESQFPGDNIHSEEFNRGTELKDRTWLIDPIDGTGNYAHNLDLFVMQIALYDHNEVVLAYIYAPRFKKIFYAIKGEGAFLNGERISVNTDNSMSNSLMSLVGLSHQSKKYKKTFDYLIDFARENALKVRVFGSAGFEMASMAEGIFSVLYTDVSNYWDLAPGLLLITEAGGFVVNELGLNYRLGDKQLFAFGNLEVKDNIMKYIKQKAE